MHSFDTSNVWQRDYSFEFDWIHSIKSFTVIRFSYSEKFYEERLQNPAAFVFKLLVVNPISGQKSSSWLKASHR